MFQAGQKVVPNGSKASAGSCFRFGGNDDMLRWEKEKTVLTVVCLDDSDGGVLAGVGGRHWWFDPSELRAATEQEIKAAEEAEEAAKARASQEVSAPDTPRTDLQPGTLVRLSTGRLAIIVHELDVEGYYCVNYLHDHDYDYYKPRDIQKALFRIDTETGSIHFE